MVGLAWYLYLGGLRALDPTNIDWIIGDHAQHLLGWLFFRNEPWALPLGRIDGLLHPIGTTVGFTDANPWVSILLKPLSPWLPTNFQFIAPWLAMCFVLQGYFGARIMESIGAGPSQRVIGAALFVLAPPLLQRLGHDTLSAHWLLLGLIWLHLQSDRSLERTLGWAFGFNVIAAGVHPYLALMLMPLTLALLVRLGLDGRLRWPAACGAGLALVLQSAAIFLLLGYLGTGEQLAEGGFGFFSADALTLINPMTYSRWLPGIGVGEGQYEGFGFLGSGALALAVVVTVSAVIRRDRPQISRAVLPLVVTAALMGIFALSNLVTIAGHVVLTMRGFYEPLAGLVEPVRASGRFVWPIHYVILTGILALAVRGPLARTSIASALLLAAVVIQAGEVRQGGRFVRQEWPRMSSAGWEEISSTYRHMVLYPAYYAATPPDCEPSSFSYPQFIQLAHEAYGRHLTLNSGYVARTSMSQLAAYCGQLQREVESGRLGYDTVYVVSPDSLESFTRLGTKVTCGRLDGFDVCVSNATGGRFRRWLARERDGAP